MTTYYGGTHTLQAPTVVKRLLTAGEEASFDQNLNDQTWKFYVEFATVGSPPKVTCTLDDAVGFNGGVYNVVADPTTGLQLPLKWAILRADVALVMMGYKIRRMHDKPNAFEIDCLWKQPNPRQPYQGKPSGTGVVWNTHLEIHPSKVEEPISQDIAGTPKAIVNTAGQIFEEGLTRTYYDSEITVSYNTDAPPISNMDACLGRVSIEAVTFTYRGLVKACAAHTLVIDDYDIVDYYEDGQAYWTVKYSILWRDATGAITSGYPWARNVLSQGLKQSDGSGGLIDCLDTNHVTCITPMMLNSSGVQTTTPYYIDFRTRYDTASTNFSSLFTGLGIT